MKREVKKEGWVFFIQTEFEGTMELVVEQDLHEHKMLDWFERFGESVALWSKNDDVAPTDTEKEEDDDAYWCSNLQGKQSSAEEDRDRHSGRSIKE